MNQNEKKALDSSISDLNETQTRIINAAFKVVDTFSVSGTRMHLIAEEAGFSSAALHYHFKTKDELMQALLDYIHDVYGVTRKNKLSHSPKNLEGQMSAFLTQNENYTIREPEYFRVQMDFWGMCHSNNAIHDSIRNSYNNWYEDILSMLNCYVPEANTDDLAFVARSLVALMIGFSVMYLADERSFDLKEFDNRVVALFSDYLK